MSLTVLLANIGTKPPCVLLPSSGAARHSGLMHCLKVGYGKVPCDGLGGSAKRIAFEDMSMLGRCTSGMMNTKCSS